MALFSQRKGIRPLNKDLQHEFMDDELRTQLWNALHILYQHRLTQAVHTHLREIWRHFFKKPLENYNGDAVFSEVRNIFFHGEWYDVYDLIEFILKILPPSYSEEQAKEFNLYLQIENAAYRIVGDKVAPITDEHEIEAIESALQQGITQTRTHLARGLELLKDRKQPDYRNSIKESISAVEAACKAITGMPKATLPDCIREIEKKAVIHRAFKDALVKLYGYTSDEGGIRHGLTENSELPSFSEAKYMLVVCAAFVNYLSTKAAELGIEMGKG